MNDLKRRTHQRLGHRLLLRQRTTANITTYDPEEDMLTTTIRQASHHLEGKLQRGRVAVVNVADHTVSLVFDLVHDTRDVHCSAPVNNTRNASFGGTFGWATIIDQEDYRHSLVVLQSLIRRIIVIAWLGYDH
uniref:Uncharacterized protein n=1 Tax=Timema douglasi TaxID=61478 RepID=A0A7R8VGD9_TIMDO|nr:unnamed protein product [Timema douglasi]